MTEQADDLGLGRREVMAGLAGGAAIASIQPAPALAATGGPPFVQGGCGSPARMFQEAIWGPHKATSSLVAICDTNPGRLAYAARRATAAGAPAPQAYLAADFARMLKEHRPDAVIVTVPDAYHVDYIV